MDAQPVVSEVKDGYARAVDAALASGSSRSAEPASSVPEPLSALNVLEASATTVADGSAAETRGVGVVRDAAPFAAAAACDFARCDAAAGPQVVDETCVSLGGLGCIGKTGCRFCKAGGVGEPGLALLRAALAAEAARDEATDPGGAAIRDGMYVAALGALGEEHAAIAAALADGDPDALALKLDDSFRTRFEGLEVEPRSEVE